MSALSISNTERKVLKLLDGIHKHIELMTGFYNQILTKVVNPLEDWIDTFSKPFQTKKSERSLFRQVSGKLRLLFRLPFLW